MNHSTLTELDSNLYPQEWGQQTFESPQNLLMALLTNQLTLNPNDFTKQLLNNTSYQEWINSTVFGRYIERNFTAFYRQTEDSFNTDMPALFRRELMRHAQFLPFAQTLFVAGNLPSETRHDKFFISTINPATVITEAKKTNLTAIKSGRTSRYELIVNQVTVQSKQVLGFPIRHNKRTSERTRNEVLILDFKDLRLVNEQVFDENKTSSTIESTIVLRDYDIR